RVSALGQERRAVERELEVPLLQRERPGRELRDPVRASVRRQARDGRPDGDLAGLPHRQEAPRGERTGARLEPGADQVRRVLVRRVRVREQLTRQLSAERTLVLETARPYASRVLLHLPEPPAQLQVERPLLDLAGHD